MATSVLFILKYYLFIYCHFIDCSTPCNIATFYALTKAIHLRWNISPFCVASVVSATWCPKTSASRCPSRIWPGPRWSPSPTTSAPSRACARSTRWVQSSGPPPFSLALYAPLGFRLQETFPSTAVVAWTRVLHAFSLFTVLPCGVLIKQHCTGLWRRQVWHLHPTNM